MNKSKRAILAALVISASTGSADAQTLELGGGVGAVGSRWTGPFAGGDVRVTIPTRGPGDVEVIVGATTLRADETLGFYGGQFRQRLRSLTSAPTQPFVTYGAIGVFYRDGGERIATAPLLGLLGFGVERRVARRLAVRVDAQAITLLVIPVGGRIAAGVSIPLGHRPAGTRSVAPR